MYTYDHTGISGFIYDNTQYLYAKNLQGDIIGIYTAAGVKEAEYAYDAYGNCRIVYDRSGKGELNAIRYRGYYYDAETNLLPFNKPLLRPGDGTIRQRGSYRIYGGTDGSP